MRRLGACLLTFLLVVGVFAGCARTDETPTYQDGVYTAGFREYDSYGYKDFVRVTVSGGVITAVEYDAVNEAGALRSKDEDYERRMSGRVDTYPRRYSANLVNQYLERGSADAVDDVAGATWSSACFKALIKALEPSMQSGSTEHVLVDNVPEK